MRLLLATAAAVGALTARAHELCLDGSGPSVASGSFSTCTAYDGLATCVAPADEASAITDDLTALGLPAGACRDDFMQPVLCARADPWAAHLFDAEAGPARTLPLLCDEFARNLYAACAAQSMTSNPFLTGGGAGTISSEFATEAAFVTAFSPAASVAYCFDGAPFELPPPEPASGADFLCVERIAGSAGWINMVPVPGFSDVMVLGAKAGQTQVVRIRGPGLAPLELGPLFDLSAVINDSSERGLLGLAFHKNFASNGRVFASYSCGSAGHCGATGTSVLEEFSVADPSNASALVVSDALTSGRIILTLSQPYNNHNGGQLLFSPAAADPHLYWFLGDGGSGGDPGNRAQNMTSPLGKVLRLDVDSAPTGGREYAIPADNPFVALGDAAARPEIWALGLRNPWRCSFDRSNPAYLYCGDVGQGAVEEVSLIVKGGNYGWRRFEGTSVHAGSTPLALGQTAIDPVIEYTHSFNNAGGAGSITGGYMYRGARVPELEGKYVFADYYDRVYVSRESPPLSGNFDIARFGVVCATDSPEPCGDNVFGIATFGEDAAGDVYFISGAGIFRILDYTACPTPAPSDSPSAAPSVRAPSAAGSTTACALLALALSALIIA